jgi:hypothetical protein
MFARLLRGTQDMKKYYIRLSSKNDDVYNSEIATSVALMLTHTNYIKVFNGKNFNAQEIIVNKDFFIKSKKSLDQSKNKSKTLSKRKLFIDVKEDKNFDVINLFKKVIEEKEKNVGLYKFCKVKEVLNQLNVSNVVLTDGAVGAYSLINGRVELTSSIKTETVDRVGAGDAFAAGVISGLVDQNIELGVSRGVAMAALKRGIYGDQLTTSLSEVEQLISGSGREVSR